MNKANLYFSLTKVDEAQRTVEGIATAEIPDKSGEVCDYESTKPYYQKWSDGIKKASGGKSLGNVRAMHGGVAAGKIIDITFDDVKKAISIVAKIIDDAEWKKCAEGVYTGFSQGGDYIKKWRDGEFTRYTANPCEVSIVDNPCLAAAGFSFVKADGLIEEREFKEQEPELEQGWKAKDGSFHKTKAEAMKKNIEVDAETAAKAAIAKTQATLASANEALDKAAPAYWETQEFFEKREFSEDKRKKMAEEGTALPDGSFPIANKEDLKNAIQAIGRAKDPEKAKSHIKARAKALDAEDMLPEEWKKAKKSEGEDEEMKKPEEKPEDKKEETEDEKKKKKKLEDCNKAVSVLKDYAGKEVFDASMAMDALQQIIFLIESEKSEDEEEGDQIAALIEACGKLKEFIASELAEDHGAEKAARDELAKRADERAEKAEALNKSLTNALENVNGQVAHLVKRIETLEAQPAPRKGAVFAVERCEKVGHESSGGTGEAVVDMTKLRLSPEEMRKMLPFGF